VRTRAVPPKPTDPRADDEATPRASIDDTSPFTAKQANISRSFTTTRRFTARHRPKLIFGGSFA
jgi:hypothetical protein